jgi:hypothetical protein
MRTICDDGVRAGQGLKIQKSVDQETRKKFTNELGCFARFSGKVAHTAAFINEVNAWQDRLDG